MSMNSSPTTATLSKPIKAFPNSPEPHVMNTENTTTVTKRTFALPHNCFSDQTLGCLRESLGNRFVYAVVSPRARGLSIGINMNPDKFCNFDCGYCEVDRTVRSPETVLD